jgi:fatty acid desaturase
MSNRKRTNRQYIVQQKKNEQTSSSLFCWTLYCLFVLFLLNILLSVRPFSVWHYIVCSSFFCLTFYCLFVLFLLDIILSVGPFSVGIMSNREGTNRQYNVKQKKDEQTIKCPTEKGRTSLFVLFLLDIILSVRPFSVWHFIVCSSFFCWTFYCLFVLFLLDIILSVRPFSVWHFIVCSSFFRTDNKMSNRKRTNRQYNVQQKKDEQTI